MNLLKLSAWLLSGILIGSAYLPVSPALAENAITAIIPATEPMQPVLSVAHDDPVCTDSDGDGECDNGSSTD